MTEQQTPPTADDRQVSESARDWLLYLYSEDASDQGRAEFSAWLGESPAHAAAYAKIEQMWRDIALVDDIDLALAAPQRKPPVDGRLSRWALRFTGGDAWGRRGMVGYGLAAGLLIAVGFWWVQSYDPVATQQFATGTGIDKLQTVLLADGSEVTLDAASTIIARFSKGRREVDLLRGSAYFDVARDAARTFRVVVDGAEIRVLGTEFDIRRRADDIQVSVTEGAVQISTVQETTSNQEDARSSIKLVAGQQVLAAVDGGIGEIGGFDVAKTLAWREGRLIYDNARLADVITDINRYRQKKIVLADEMLGEIRLTTTFTVDQSDQILIGLAATKPVVVEDQGYRIYIRPEPKH